MRALALAIVGCFAFLLVVVAPRPKEARADDEATYECWRALDDGAVSLKATLRTGPDGGRTTSLTVQLLDDKLATKGSAVSVYDGPIVFSTLAVRPGVGAVAMFRRGVAPFAKVALVDLAKGTSRVIDLPRTAPSQMVPMSAVACADEGGFTLLWQEQNPADLSASSEAHSTMARVKADGTVLMKPTHVEIPWALGAIVDDGRGYTLAVLYGNAIDQTRICFVTLTREGTPEQHPWWGSMPSRVEEVQLTMVSGAAMATYRAGTTTKSIVAVTADKSGSWGKEAAPSRDLAAKTPSAPFGVREKAGALQLVQR